MDTGRGVSGNEKDDADMSRFSNIVKELKTRTKTQLENEVRQQVEEDVTDPGALAASHIDMSISHETAFIIGKPRASSIGNARMRYHVIGTVKKVAKKEWSSVRSRVLFGYGNAYHYWVQNTPDVFGNRRIGWWLCRACEKVVHFGFPVKQPCKHCGASYKAAVYLEHHLDLGGAWPISGHPDLFLDVNSLIRVVEVKTINGDEFDKLKSAKHEHEYQTQTYMWGCSKDKKLPVKIDPSVGYVLYISKKYTVKVLPFKMFRVKKNQAVLRNIQAKARSYRTGVEHFPEALPDLDPECDRNDFRNYKAKQCPCKKVCMKYA
jgi:hypothetical protein